MRTELLVPPTDKAVLAQATKILDEMRAATQQPDQLVSVPMSPWAFGRLLAMAERGRHGRR